MNQLINDKGVCRTAPATPGLLITLQGIESSARHFVSLCVCNI